MSNTTKTIAFIDHYENPRDDLAWTYIKQRGFNQKLFRPFQGDALPETTENIDGLIVYGGSQNVGEQDQYPYLTEEIKWIKSCLQSNIPMLGICLGAQLIAHCLGANVGPREPVECEFGYYPLQPTPEGKTIFPNPLHVTEAHYQEFELPKGATRLASTERFQNQAFQYKDNVFALQFHPEVTETIFTRGQNEDWAKALYKTQGSQTKEQQDPLMQQHSEVQSIWFRSFLDQMFKH